MKKGRQSLKTPFSEITNPGKKIKDWYGLPFAKVFSNELDLPSAFLSSYKKKYNDLELKGRVQLLSELTDFHLTGTYPEKLERLKVLFGPEWPYEEGMLGYGFHLYPVSQFAEMYGARDVRATISFAEELTKRFTSEFVMRTVANHSPDIAMRAVKKWTKDRNFHVRRLASEGMRARLPWGKSVQWITENPEKTIPVFSYLRNDSSLYVRRSVANAMGDIVKLNEDLAMETFQKWLSEKNTKENLWVISHAIRHPVKKKRRKFVLLRKEIEGLKRQF
ncbi:MAG TPA: hypothetical protein PKA63_13020 [Oligoflexia bacterium]|nr:hypothetical protein [Oligoflexia bacterium]HMP49581.1 hypothetical protein [Oligoflexia bacterium]